MPELINIYCDESCHLEKDHQEVMVLGAISCPDDKKAEVFSRIRDFKEKHNLPRWRELKWTKVSPSIQELYEDVVDYFFDDDDLRFRAVIAEKDHLDHARYNGNSHDEWYYKMYFYLLGRMISDDKAYKIFIDIKDRKGNKKVLKLQEILCNRNFDFNQSTIQNIQRVRSHEVELVQLADIFTGCICHHNRDGGFSSTAKKAVIEKVIQRSGYDLKRTNYSAKFNIFRWSGRRS